MAIIVDEEEKKSNLFSVVGWLALFIIVGVAIYYVFFAQPQLVSIPAAGNLNTIAPIAQISLHPDTIVQSPAFQALKSTITVPVPNGPASVGRTNPFLAP